MSDLERGEALLLNGLQKLRLSLSPEPFLRYVELIYKWNQAYNLTAVRDIPNMVIRHVLDSLAVLHLVPSGRLLDVGSGAGLPGIPIALAQPERSVVLLDSNGKKTRFLQEAQRLLCLDNLEVVQTRVEDYNPAQNFSVIISRAFSDIFSFVAMSQHLLAPKGQWLAMKSRQVSSELSTLTMPHQVEAYAVPGLLESRCCVVIRKAMKTASE